MSKEDPYRSAEKKYWLVTLAWNAIASTPGLGAAGGSTYYETLIVCDFSLSTWYVKEQSRREVYDRNANEAMVKGYQEGKTFLSPIEIYTGHPFAHIVNHMRIPPDEAVDLASKLRIEIRQD